MQLDFNETKDKIQMKPLIVPSIDERTTSHKAHKKKIPKDVINRLQIMPTKMKMLGPGSKGEGKYTLKEKGKEHGQKQNADLNDGPKVNTFFFYTNNSNGGIEEDEEK